MQERKCELEKTFIFQKKVSPINRIGGRKRTLIERADFVLMEKQTGLSLNYKVES